MFASNRGQMGVYHVLARQHDNCSVGKCLEGTALTTSFMRHVTKVDIRETCAGLRKDVETSSRRHVEDDLLHLANARRSKRTTS